MKLAALYNELDQRTRNRLAGGIIVLLLLALGYSLLHERIGLLQKKRASREAAVKELLLLSHQFKTASANAQRLGNRLSAVKADDSPAKIVEEIGIKGKSTQVKPVKGEERQGMVEDGAEIRIDGLTANEAINLIYRLEKGTRPVLVKKANLKTRYDDPARMDVTLTAILLKPLPKEQK
jgi:general secretion pathway protein M